MKLPFLSRTITFMFVIQPTMELSVLMFSVQVFTLRQFHSLIHKKSTTMPNHCCKIIKVAKFMWFDNTILFPTVWVLSHWSHQYLHQPHSFSNGTERTQYQLQNMKGLALFTQKLKEDQFGLHKLLFLLQKKPLFWRLLIQLQAKNLQRH